MVRSRSTIRASRDAFRVVEGGRRGAGEGPEQSDAELLDAFERRDPRACDELYERLIGTVEGTLFRVLGRRDELHDDLVQSSFEQILTTLYRRRFARACPLRAWAASVTSNLAFNELRRRIRERRVIDPWTEPSSESALRGPSVDAERDAVVRELLGRVRLHLIRMKPERASTVFMHDVMGHDLAEIAVISGVSVSAAQSRLFRGRKELHARLSKDGWYLDPGDDS